MGFEEAIWNSSRPRRIWELVKQYWQRSSNIGVKREAFLKPRPPCRFTIRKVTCPRGQSSERHENLASCLLYKRFIYPSAAAVLGWGCRRSLTATLRSLGSASNMQQYATICNKTDILKVTRNTIEERDVSALQYARSISPTVS